MKKFIKEFKEFAIKGNVIDLAVGVVIGGAFGKIVSSLVADVIMPFVGILVGGINLANLKWVVQIKGQEPVELMYGNFLQNVIDFLIVAFCIFVVVKIINQLKELGKKEDGKKEPKTETELDLLKEIRNLLKKQVKDTKRK